MSLYEGVFMGRYPGRDGSVDTFDKLIDRQRGFAQGVAEQSASSPGRSPLRVPSLGLFAGSRSRNGGDADLCTARDYLESGWIGSGGQGIVLSNEAMKREMSACIKLACFAHSFCQGTHPSFI